MRKTTAGLLVGCCLLGVGCLALLGPPSRTTRPSAESPDPRSGAEGSTSESGRTVMYIPPLPGGTNTAPEKAQEGLGHSLISADLAKTAPVPAGSGEGTLSSGSVSAQTPGTGGGARAAPMPPPATSGSSDAATSSDQKIVMRPLMRFKDASAAAPFVALLARRQEHAQEVPVLSRLLQQKAMEFREIEASLREKFDIEREGNYHYDAASKTIYWLPASALTNGVLRTDISKTEGKRLHRKLSAKDEEAFLAHLRAKQAISSRFDSLRAVFEEKEAQLVRVNNELAARYSVSRDRAYKYDRGALTLYEYVSAPDTAEMLDADGNVLPAMKHLEFQGAIRSDEE